ncbi:MAG: TonB-dependent receptor [bacterium]
MKIYFLSGKFYKLTAVVICFFISSNILANTLNAFSGLVYDGELNKPISNVVVLLIEKDIYTVSDENGKFEFKNIETGEYKIKFLHIAFKEKITTFVLTGQNKSSLIVFLVPNIIEFAPIVISSKNNTNTFEDLYELSNVLKGKELEKDLGITLASTLKNETGIAMRTMGPAPARPVIRGLSGDRVFLSEDGIKTNDMSSTSPDHAVTIEPFTIEKIEVLRGPRVLLFTSTTIGGIVNVVRNEIPEVLHNKIYGTAGVYGETTNRCYLGSLTTQIPLDPLSLYLEFSHRDAKNINTPVGELKNSFSNNTNYAFGLSYINSKLITGVSFRKYNLEYGIPGGFIGAHPFGVNIKLARKQLNFKTTYLFNLDERLKFDFSYAAYKHDEYEHNGLVGAEFKVVNYMGNIHYLHNNLWIFNKGEFGIEAKYNDFNVGGYVFTSPTKSSSVSSYIYESFDYGGFSFELAGRINYDKINPKYEGKSTNIGIIKSREFGTYSLSLSSLYRLSDVVFFGANISKSSRVPTTEELYSQGPHLAAYSYEIGNPNLESEKGYGSEIFVYHKFEDLFFNITFFRNDLSYYIIARNTGSINYSTFLPIYESSGVKALFYGYEIQSDIKINNNLSLSVSSSYTIGKFKNTDKYLPQIPPIKGFLEIKYSNKNFQIGLNAEFAGKQNKVDLFENPTNGYTVINGNINYSFELQEMVNSFWFSAENIFNKEYRNHLSRVKVIMPEAGRNFRLTYRLYFHI